MYIVAIAWIYVIFMMSITEKSVVAGVLTFVFYGLLPLMIILWLAGAPQRGRNRAKAARAAAVAQAEIPEPPREKQPGSAPSPARRTIE